MNIKMTCAGQPCQQCGTPVEKRYAEKWSASCFCDWYLQCPNQKCWKMFLVETSEGMDTPNPDLVVFDIDKREPVFEIDRVEIPATS
jgi:hypothetical protein